MSSDTVQKLLFSLTRATCPTTPTRIIFFLCGPSTFLGSSSRALYGCYILVNNQLDALFNVFIYFTSLYVSSNPVLIIRRIKLCQYII